MAKPPRSPLLGYNHNVKYGGHIFHVQTEDSGPGNPHLFTHLFFEGSILASKRGQYDPGLPEDEVRTMMQAQHKAILKELKQSSYDERITRFFEMRGETFRPDDFFTGKVEAPEAITTPEPAVMAPTAAAAPAEVEVLDLDALPAAPTERASTPEPLPIHVTKPSMPGPGTYTFRRPTREQFSSDPAPPAAPSKPAAAVRPGTVRPIMPVVVQRQVIVGTGAPATASMRKPTTTTPVRRRPVSGGPYVVKQGSHANIAGNLAGSSGSHPAEPPAHPVAPATEPAQAPRTAEPKRSPTQEGAPSVFVTDQSLDDVILAYLSQGERKR